MKLEGVDRVLANLARIRRGMTEHSAKALRAEAERVVAVAKSVVPVRTGALRDSIRTEDAGPLAVRVVAGGPTAPYAVQVHEETDRPGAKFLERPAMEASSGMAQRLARDIEKGIR